MVDGSEACQQQLLARSPVVRNVITQRRWWIAHVLLELHLATKATVNEKFCLKGATVVFFRSEKEKFRRLTHGSAVEIRFDTVQPIRRIMRHEHRVILHEQQIEQIASVDVHRR